MKVIIESRDNQEALRMLKVDSAYSALYAITQHLRSEYKYNEKAPIEYLDTLRDQVYSLLEDNGIDLDFEWN